MNEQPHGITGLSQIATIVGQLMLSRMSNMPFPLYTSPGGLSLQEICPPVLSNRIS